MNKLSLIHNMMANHQECTRTTHRPSTNIKDKVDQCPQPSFCKKNKLANAKGNYTAGKNMCIHLISTTNLSIKKPETA
jgi:hypothetical protein